MTTSGRRRASTAASTAAASARSSVGARSARTTSHASPNPRDDRGAELAAPRRSPVTRHHGPESQRRQPSAATTACLLRGGQLAVDRQRQRRVGGGFGRAGNRRAGSRATRSTPAGGTAPGSRSRCRSRARSGARARGRGPARGRRTGCRCGSSRRLDRQRRPAVEPGSREQPSIAVGVRRGACAVHAREVRQLDPQHRRLQRVEPEVAADPLVEVLRLRAVIAQQPDFVRERRVVGRDQAGVAERAEVLARERTRSSRPRPSTRPGGPGRSRRSPGTRPRSPGCRGLAAIASSGSMSAHRP